MLIMFISRDSPIQPASTTNTLTNPAHSQHPPGFTRRNNNKYDRRSPPLPIAIPILLNSITVGIMPFTQIPLPLPLSVTLFIQPISNNKGLLVHRLLLKKGFAPQPLPIGFIPLLLQDILLRDSQRVLADLEHLNIKRLVVIC